MGLKNQNYNTLLQNLKMAISKSLIHAHMAMNKEMICLYCIIGNWILLNQEKEGWKAKVIENISMKLRKKFPSMKGSSIKSFLYMQSFARAYPDFSNTQ